MSAAVSISMYEPTSNEASRYQAILEKKIRDGAARAGSLLATIEREVPKDQIASTRALTFRPTEKSVGIEVAGEPFTASRFAFEQVAERAGVPGQYLGKLMSGSDWQRELAAELLQRHYANGQAARLLLRSVNGQIRGWLSDSYRRLDSRPLLDALVTEAQAISAVPYDGVATDTRVALKVLLPEILEIVPGEYVVRGGEWSNSDFGNGTHSFRAFGLRVACLNGMTRENILRQVHLGAKLSENIVFSQRTYELDTAASVSALRDVVRGTLGPASKDAFLEGLRAMNEKEFSPAQLRSATKNLPKVTQKSVVDAFESQDVVNLPAGNTAWRASNAISWIARHTESDETRLDLERLAGAVK